MFLEESGLHNVVNSDKGCSTAAVPLADLAGYTRAYGNSPPADNCHTVLTFIKPFCDLRCQLTRCKAILDHSKVSHQKRKTGLQSGADKPACQHRL